MKKLLHERLREAAKNGVSNIETYDENIVVSLLKDEELSLADEIEKYYIPRPRFEDGEPVQRADKIDWENLGDYHPQSPWMITAIRNDGRPIATAGDKVVAVAKITDDGFVKRHEPKILDADGVEIKVGCYAVMAYDKTWGKTISYVGTNARSDCRCPQKNARQEPFVVYEEGGWDYARNVICYEPDSLEKLRNDMAEYKTDTHFAEIKTEHTFGEFIDRLTAIMERDA